MRYVRLRTDRSSAFGEMELYASYAAPSSVRVAFCTHKQVAGTGIPVPATVHYSVENSSDQSACFRFSSSAYVASDRIYRRRYVLFNPSKVAVGFIRFPVRKTEPVSASTWYEQELSRNIDPITRTFPLAVRSIVDPAEDIMFPMMNTDPLRIFHAPETVPDPIRLNRSILPVFVDRECR